MPLEVWLPRCQSIERWLPLRGKGSMRGTALSRVHGHHDDKVQLPVRQDPLSKEEGEPVGEGVEIAAAPRVR